MPVASGLHLTSRLKAVCPDLLPNPAGLEISGQEGDWTPIAKLSPSRARAEFWRDRLPAFAHKRGSFFRIF